MHILNHHHLLASFSSPLPPHRQIRLPRKSVSGPQNLPTGCRTNATQNQPHRHTGEQHVTSLCSKQPLGTGQASPSETLAHTPPPAVSEACWLLPSQGLHEGQFRLGWGWGERSQPMMSLLQPRLPVCGAQQVCRGPTDDLVPARINPHSPPP